MGDKSEPSFKIIFKKSKDHQMYPAAGAWGGPTPQGDILCNFFVEYQDTPDKLTLEFEETAQTQKETQHREENIYIREITTSVLLRPDIAKAVGKWLIDNADRIYKDRELISKKIEGSVQ